MVAEGVANLFLECVARRIGRSPHRQKALNSSFESL